MIGGASTPLALHELSLVAFDNFGCPQPLPPGLGNLPLYPDYDGTFSVNGRLDLAVSSPHEALAPITGDHHAVIHPLIPGIPRFSCANPHSTCTPDRDSHYSNHDAITRFVISPLFRPPLLHNPL